MKCIWGFFIAEEWMALWGGAASNRVVRVCSGVVYSYRVYCVDGSGIIERFRHEVFDWMQDNELEIQPVKTRSASTLENARIQQ